MIGFLFAITLFFQEGRPYLGLVAYILLPAVMILGLLLIPIGMLIQMRRMQRRGVRAAPAWPRVDLNDRRHRNAFSVFSVGTTLLLLFSAIGSYEAYEYTESVSFCGTVCHSVMHPENTAYQYSPHARVSCVGCHVGPGADWYVRSKMSGLYQVYSVLFNRYSRPIPTPVENLRPAREVCEECHWPQKFYSQKIRLETHYLNDEANTEWDIYLLMKIGAEHSALGLTEGIHWHINPDVKIEYIASDEERLKLPWVRYTNTRTGETKVYQDTEEALNESQIASAGIRTMDCIDCHNRPSHNYQVPTLFVNNAMTAGEIPRNLPGIKALAMEICAEEFNTSEEAMAHIEEKVVSHYREEHPELYQKERSAIEQAIEGLKQAFSRNIFPAMKVKWDAYPNHIGHLEFDGCFRCHNNRHTSSDNTVISMDCNLCHIINAQGTPGQMEIAGLGEALEFKHPEDIGEMWKESLCTDCHTGLNP
jgi:formate-dependent nitrite reductase cytochrome c552 subunit